MLSHNATLAIPMRGSFEIVCTKKVKVEKCVFACSVETR